MTVHYSAHFVRAFHKAVKRNPELRQKVKVALRKFQADPASKGLRLHKLSGGEGDWSLSMGMSVRLIFQYTDDGILLTDIGSHNEVY